MNILERLVLRLTDDHTEPDRAVLLDCIETAKNAILSRRFPYGEWPTRTVEVDGVEVEETYVEPRYEDLQFRIAMDLYNRIGLEGQVGSTENGIRRDFDAEWISKQLLNEITPYVGVVNG